MPSLRKPARAGTGAKACVGAGSCHGLRSSRSEGGKPAGREKTTRPSLQGKAIVRRAHVQPEHEAGPLVAVSGKRNESPGPVAESW